MGNLGNIAVAAGSLAGADYLSNNVVSEKIIEVSGQLAERSGDILSGTLENTAPILASASPIALLTAAGLGVYKGIKATARDGIVQGIKEGSLWYSLPAGVMVALGLTSTAPGAVAAGVIGLGIHGLQKTYGLGKTFMQAPGENLKYGITQPFKWTGGALKSLFKGKGGGAPTP